MDEKLVKKLKLRFISLCAGEDFFLPVKKGMRDAGDALNADCSFVGTDDIDIPRQVRMLEAAVSEGVDGIALNLADADAFTPAIGIAARAGIPVVAFNIDASRGKAGNAGAVCQDFYSAGRALGGKAAQQIEPGARILATVHSDGISALEDRLRGIKESLRSKDPSWTLVTTGMIPDAASERIAAALAADSSIAAVLCTGQADTEGAGLAAQKLPASRRPSVAGFDLSPRILALISEGIISFTIDQQPYLQGFLPVVQLVLNIRYGIRPSFVDAGAAIIEKDNVKAVLELSRQEYR
jgi:simple sugar transport system substrate-binding protein